MGNLFGSTRYVETEADKALRLDIEKKRKEEEKEKLRLEKEDLRKKKRASKGFLGNRTLFSSAGQQGFFRDGEEI